MSKSLGTGIDPLDEIDVHGADALRFGLLAMSSTQDVRFSAAKVQQGRDLANKIWNASRLILLNAGGAEPGPRADRVEDRWILSRLERTVESVTGSLDSYDFAHAAFDFYAFFWSELCDWYLEIVKPRLYDGEEDAAANLLFVLERVLALAHPIMPFVTEEVWSYLPGEREMLLVSEFPQSELERVDADAERELGAAIELTRQLRRWRDLVGVPAGTVLEARVGASESLHELVPRLARLDLNGAGAEALATIGPVEILASGDVDAAEAERRIGERRDQLSAEVARAEGKLANEGFVAKAPQDVVDAERAKLERYREELRELGA
jgi:valyl-tRNA synthetase